MYWTKISIVILLDLLVDVISSKSITFSYRTCLPNIDLIAIEHTQNVNSERFQLSLRDFHLQILHSYQNGTSQYQLGPAEPRLSFDDHYQSALNYYQRIDTWNYVNLTFDDPSSQISLSFNTDERRTIPLIQYPWLFVNHTLESTFDVNILLDPRERNVSCLLPYAGFPPKTNSDWNRCSTNIKTCEHRICTSSNSAEQYCPLFPIFDCHPFTDVLCAARTLPVRCSADDCDHEGTCYIDTLKNVSRCVCPSGFAGERCQYSLDECQSSPCPQHSKCLDQPNGYRCVCESGWTGRDCLEDIDECETMKPCKAARHCINQAGSYKCDCLENFVGQNCEMTLDPCLSQPCLNNASKCHSILDRDYISFHCTCQSGFTGHRCETNINDCEGIVCPKNNTQCIDGINSFHCECKPNFKRNWDGSCVEQNPCDSSPCHQNATCFNLNGGQYRCMCPPTYTGSQCDEDIDECTVFPFICRNGGTCVNEIGSYRCYCPAGWVGPTCVKAIDHCLSQPCNRNGTCINKINGYECRCLPAYTGQVCQYDIDECVIDPCFNNGTCYNYVGGFHCRCAVGFFGFHCEYPPAECKRLQQASLAVQCTDPHLCLVNDTEKLRQINQLSVNTCKTERDRILDSYFTCLEEHSSDRCHCPSNILPCADNYTQTYSKSLLSKSSCPCRGGGTCHWRNSTEYRCYCPPGLTGESCQTSIDHCSSRPCYHNGTCLSQLNTFTCRCPSNYHGPYCQTLLDPCEANPCLNNGTCELQKNKTYHCRCPSSAYSGKHCEIYKTPCSSQPCQNRGTCFNLQTTFQCHCPFRYQGRHCDQPIDLCRTPSETNLCLNGGKCSTSNQTIECTCLPGFTGLFCESNIDECYGQPCSTHGQCIDLINGYQCRCESGWYGMHCETKQGEISKSFTYHVNTLSVFHLRQSSINISRSLPYRHSSLPIRIQYEFRTTLKAVALLSIGQRFKQELIDQRILTNLDNKTILSTFFDDQQQWMVISIEVFHLWIDVRIGKNALSQRFYVSNTSLAALIQQHVLFGGQENYSGCVRNIEITYSQLYSILLTDQLVETNENRTLGCERTNACDNAMCRPNEFCEDHWFYYTCLCQRPFFGDHCDEIAPIVTFNQSSVANLSFSSPISNMSLFFNTLQANGTLFELLSSPKQERSIRHVPVSNRPSPKIIGALIDGRFRLIIVDDGPKRQEFELRSEQQLNDGRPHQIQLDLDRYQLMIDGIHNETLTPTNNRFTPDHLEFLGDGSLKGWLQDVRVNDRLIPFDKSTQLASDFNVTTLNMNPSLTNPCYPTNPCLNRGLCVVTTSQDYICQCEENWFGRNCSEINICDYNKTTLCPEKFVCRITGENQECLASATFEGNTSSLIATLSHSSIDSISNELTFRLRARPQHAHLLTVKNLHTSNYFSLYLFERNLIYRDSILTTDLLIDLNNDTFEQWTTFHFYWSDFSTLTINHQYTYTVSQSLKSLLTPNGQTQIFVGNGFRGCLEYVRVGEDLYLPFYHDEENRLYLRRNKFVVEQFENIANNNCSFDHVCASIHCEHGHCVDDFDRGKCLCKPGWNGDSCQININECDQGNNCSKENGVCEDHPDGFYTCRCHAGFTGKYCETNIDECASSPCANDGTCLDLINGYKCNCTSEYINHRCTQPLAETCFGSRYRCVNNATCQLRSAHLYVENPVTECQCQAGYSGRWCEDDACSALTCQHNSTCQRLSNGQAKCLCNEHWSGHECQNDVNECEKNPCLNNGTCVNQPGSYECSCPGLYLGRFCERQHVCLERSPCLNHGRCRTKGENYYCECSSNFTGSLCQFVTCDSMPCQNNGTCHDDAQQGYRCNCSGTGYEDERCTTTIDECLGSPCQNNATCIDDVGGYTCLCPKHFMGPRCENKIFIGSWGFSYHYVVWPILALVLLLLIILLAITMTRIRESRRSRGTYRPAVNENGQTSRVEFSMILKPPPEERLI